MNNYTKYIIQNTVDGKIDKKVGAKMIEMFIQDKNNQAPNKAPKDIAIVGMSVKMPKADDIEEFWKNIESGAESIRDIPDARKKDMEELLGIDYDFKNNQKQFIKAGYLNEIDKFDYKFFKISPMEAKLIDPCQRLFLQTAYKAIEDAGYNTEKLAGTNTGVFVGHSDSNVYGSYIMRTQPQLTSMSIPGNMAAILSGRLSYLLDLKGPSLLVNTACSSSLVAIYLACKSIRNGDCEQAIAGGVRINYLPIEGAYEAGIESKSNKVRAFDDNADGTSWGEGVGVIMLKPLEKALEDKDNIYAVIKGVAANQDGTSVSQTAPNSLAQKEVIMNAWKDAGIDPETISYIETHGTGTKLGDPVEITGIQKAFNQYTNKKQFCAIGSIKPNIGHLDNASGVASLIKAVLSIKHKIIPPCINFETPNRAIYFEQSPVYVADRKMKWQTEGFPRRCGVSSFGFSGTNCHIILEEAPEINETNNESHVPEILVLSAKSKESLWNLIKSYIKFLGNTQSQFNDICYTAATGRSHFDYRLAIKANCIEDALKKMEGLNEASLGSKSFVENDIYYGVISSKNINLTNVEDYDNLQIKGTTTNLDNIAVKYISGGSIDWYKFYENTGVRKVSIPTYQFEENRCWVDWEYNIEKNITTTINNSLQGNPLVETSNQKISITGRSNNKYTQTELKIGEICGKLLGIKEIDIHDDFIDLGVNSLIALQFETEMEKENIVINYYDISSYPTIAELSKFIDENNKTNSNSESSNNDAITQKISSEPIKEDKILSESIQTTENYSLHDVSLKDENSLDFKELNISLQKDLTVYLHWSLPLCIALSDDRFRPWFYNKFIQIFSHTDDNGYVLLNYLENYNNICEISKYQSLGGSIVNSIPSIINFVIENINEGFYLIINLDESFLNNKASFGSDTFVHDSLIYGYDNETKCFKAIGFDKNHMFTKIEFEYNEFEKAFESAKINYAKQAPYCEWNFIRLIKLHDSDNKYPFSLEAFINELKNYLFSIEDKGKTYIYGLEHHGGSYDYGFKVYDVYINKMKKMLDGIFEIDYRATHLIAEHKKCISDRLKFIASEYDMPNEFNELCDEFTLIAEKFEQLRIKAYIQSSQVTQSNSVSVLLSDINKQAILNIIDTIEILKNDEYRILIKIYEILKSSDFILKNGDSE